MDVCVGVGWSGTAVNDLIIEPCREKTCLWGLGPGPTQTRLCSQRSYIARYM